MPSVNLILPAGEAVVTGKQITFSSPCSNDGLNSILINGIEYALVDACRKPIGDVPEVFVRGALVSVVIDESNKLAYVQNAANNRYGIPIKQSIVDGVATLALNTKYRVYAEVKHEVEADYFDCTVKLGSDVKSIVTIATLPSIEVTDTHREYFDIKILSVSRNTGDSTEDTVIYEIDGVRNQYSYPVVVLSMPVPTTLLVKGATSVYSCPENMTGGTFVTPDGDATPGEDGGYYVPAVTDNEDGTVTFTFSASKDEMATIDPITIELPKGVAGAHVTSVEEYWGDATHTTYRMTFSNDTHYDFDVYHGHDGADGGHYTPSIKDNDNGTMTVSFSASKEGMPDINPVTVTIPKGKDGGHYSPSIHTITEDSFKISFTPSNSDMPVVEDVTITLPTAEDGVGIESIVQTTTSKEDGGENVITITLTNGNKSTFKVRNGSKGGKGDAGKGISKIEKTSTSGLSDTYTITYTDGSTSTYTVKNGSKGDTGVGIKSVVKTSTSGLVDTYTITFTNNTTTTFTITNGQNGKDGAKGDPYTLTDADKASIVQAVIAELGGRPVFGYLDEENHIIFNIDIAEGEYEAYFKDENGNLTKGGRVIVEAVKTTYTITWVVDGVSSYTTVEEGVVPTFGGSTDKASDGQYNYTFAGWTPDVVAATADATYTAVYNKTVIEVEPTTYKVTFVADGVTVKVVEYTEGETSLDDVPSVPDKDGYTGAWEPYTLNNTNITVNAVYTAIVVEPTYNNLADPSSSDWLTGSRLASTGTKVETGMTTTNYIDCKQNDEFYVKGLDVTKARTALYASKTDTPSSCSAPSFPNTNANSFDTEMVGTDVYKFKVRLSTAKFIRFSGKLVGTANDVIITKNEPIE